MSELEVEETLDPVSEVSEEVLEEEVPEEVLEEELEEVLWLEATLAASNSRTLASIRRSISSLEGDVGAGTLAIGAGVGVVTIESGAGGF